MKSDWTHWHIPEHDQNVKKTVVIVVELLNLENSLRIISFLLQSERMSSKSPSEKREMKIEDRRRIGCFFLWKFIRSFRFYEETIRILSLQLSKLIYLLIVKLIDRSIEHSNSIRMSNKFETQRNFRLEQIETMTKFGIFSNVERFFFLFFQNA